MFIYTYIYICLYIIELLRKYPEIFEQFSSCLEPAISAMNNSTNGLSSLVWILGEFGENLINSPYIIENLLENFADYESNELINSLLLASCKLFFKSPGEMQSILGKVFDFVINNFNDIDLKDRAMYFYNLIKSDIEEAEYIICGERAQIDRFISTDDELNDVVFSEFNTLSIIYNKPEEKFIKNFIEVDEIINKGEEYQNEQNEQNEGDDNENKENSNVNEQEEQGNEYDKSVNLQYSKDNLEKFIIINDDEFAELMREFDKEYSKDYADFPEIDIDGFVEYLESEHVFVKAHKQSDDGIMKMLLYSKDSINNAFILTEMQLDISSSSLNYKIRQKSNVVIKNYITYLDKVLLPLFE